MKEKQNQKKKVLILVLVLGLVLLTIGGTYAFFTYVRQGQKENTLTTGIMYFVYYELPGQDGNQISITNAFPMTDDQGKVQENEGVFEFQVRAKTQGANINYEIYLTKNDSSTLPNKVVKTYLSTIAEKGGPVLDEEAITNQWTEQDVNLYSKLWNSSLPILTGPAKTLEQATVPDSPEEYEKTYRYRMWLDENANGVNNKGEWIYSNKNFSVGVNVYASNEELPPPTPPVEEATLVSQDYWFSTYSSGIQRSQVTRIEFIQSKMKPEGTIKSWSVSSNKYNDIIAYLTKNEDGEDTYTVTIGSDAETIYMNASSSLMFSYFSGLKEIKGLELLDTSSVTDMYGMFMGCSQLTDLSLISGWDTSSVTDIHNMFSSCSQLTDLSLISGWDTSHVTDMSGMFNSCRQLTELDLSSWDTSSVTTMKEMFRNCSQLTDLSSISGWDTSSITDMSGMFNGCSQLTELDLSSWDTSSVTYMNSMFWSCSQLSDLSFLEDWDTSSVENMTTMFKGCSQSITLDLSNWNTSSVTDMHQMFDECKQLSITITIRGNVTSYNNMFRNAATAEGASIIVNYVDDNTRTIAEAMVATNNGAGHVSLGEQVQ